MSFETQAQFTAHYCELHQITEAQLAERGLFVIPCDCTEGCRQWRVVSRHSSAYDRAQRTAKDTAFQLLLRLADVRKLETPGLLENEMQAMAREHGISDARVMQAGVEAAREALTRLRFRG